MGKYRKRPVVIEAMRYDAVSCRAICEWIGVGHPERPDDPCGVHPLCINTLEGEMLAKPGDWIIRGIAGEFYPCKPDIFEATYEEVE